LAGTSINGDLPEYQYRPRFSDRKVYSGGMNLEDCRRFYAEEVRWCAGLKTAALVEAFARVPREQFLGPGPWRVASPEAIGAAATRYTETSEPRDLYHNLLVALDASRNINNGQPSALGKWIDALELKPGERVFHLGSGVGYYTAILAETVGASGQVVASEVDPHLAARARENLSGYPNVTVEAADGAELDTGECDAMLINAGVTHPHPRWLSALREGGRVVLPLTSVMPQLPELGRGAMMKIVRQDTSFSAEMISYVAIYACTSVRHAELNAPIGKALASGSLVKVRSLRREDHEQTDTCVVHGGGVCWSKAEVGA
jgi:protein-L-isoaspartate(D-aspartate) O-methyltransferase